LRFLIEILEGRGFSSLWISQIKTILEGSRTCINFNGTLSEYFPYKKGVRQGDPLSPFLFDLVADVFHRILQKAQSNGILRGLGDFGNLGQILNLHFADDTLLFLEAPKDNIEILKWILLGYEDLSDMKINFAKSELVPLNLTEEECTKLAEQLGCKVSSIPLIYLGMILEKNYQLIIGISLLKKLRINFKIERANYYL
jgi:Reverse transcriptase (RNA-dependent DNA polymerase)